MQHASRLIALLLVVGACGDGLGPAAVDGGLVADADAAPAPCSAIAVGSTDLEPWRVATVQWLRDQGHPGTTSELQGGDTISLRGFRAEIGATEPGPAAVGWILGLPGFPVPPEQVEVGELKQVVPDAATLIVVRPLVGVTPARLFRPLASVQLTRRLDEVWEVRSFTLWASTALMSEAEAVALAGCSPNAPPPRAPIEQTTFEGLTMSACAIVGDYTYQPDAADRIEYAEALDWVVVGERWRARRRATLVIAEENHWPGIAGADCYCHEVAGFDLHVDATGGEVLDYRPGVNCVVC